MRSDMATDSTEFKSLNRHDTQACIWNLNEIHPMRLFYNIVRDTSSKYITLGDYSDNKITLLNQRIFTKNGMDINPRAHEEHYGIPWFSKVDLVKYYDTDREALYRFYDTKRLNINFPVIFDDGREDLVKKIITIMNPLIRNFYKIFKSAMIKSCDLPYKASVDFYKVLPIENVIDVDYEPFYIISTTTGKNLIMYPSLNKICMYPTIYNKDMVVVNYSNTKDCYSKAMDILGADNKKLDNVTIHPYTHKANTNIYLGNLVNYLMCDIKGGLCVTPFLIHINSIGKAVLIKKPSNIERVFSTMYNNSGALSMSNDISNTDTVATLNASRKTALLKFIDDVITPYITSIFNKAIEAEIDHSVPVDLMGIEFRYIIKNFTTRSAKIHICIIPTKYSNDLLPIYTFHLYNYDNYVIPGKQEKYRIQTIERMIGSFKMVKNTDYGITMTTLANYLDKKALDSIAATLINQRKFFSGNRGSSIMRVAFSKIWDIINKGSYYREILEKVCDLYHSFDEEFNRRADIITIKKNIKQMSLIKSSMDEDKTDLIISSINHLTYKNCNYDIDKYIEEVNYHCNTRLQLRPIIIN